VSQPTKLDPGRVDHLAHGLFKKLLKTANPQIQFACKMFNPEIEEAFEETFGPGTSAHKIGQRIMRAVEDKS
jgi:hypothetical protein